MKQVHCINDAILICVLNGCICQIKLGNAVPKIRNLADFNDIIICKKITAFSHQGRNVQNIEHLPVTLCSMKRIRISKS